MPLTEVVMRNLKAARVDKALSQETLAQRCGLSVSYISMLERGQRSPPLDTLEVLAKGLKVPVLHLLGAR